MTARLLAAALLVAAAAGCRTCHGVDEDWTVETALEEIRDWERTQEADEEKWTWLEPAFIPGHGAGMQPHTVRWADIAKLQLRPRIPPNDTFPYLPVLLGPLVYDLHMVLDDETEFRLWKRCYGGLSIFPFWLYPYIPVHGYPLGHAIDYMRLKAEERGTKKAQR